MHTEQGLPPQKIDSSKPEGEVTQNLELEPTTFHEARHPMNSLVMDRMKKHPSLSIEGKLTPEAQLIQYVLDEVDSAALENFEQYRPKDENGRERTDVAFPVTRLDVNALYASLVKKAEEVGIPIQETLFRKSEEDNVHDNPRDTEKNKPERLSYVIIPGFDFPPLTNGPFSSMEITIDRVFRSFARVRAGDVVNISVVGYPYSLGGETSEEWIEKFKAKRYGQYGEDIAPFVAGRAQEESSSRIIVTGHSMGGMVADAVGGELAAKFPEVARKTRLLLDSPVETHGMVDGAMMTAAYGLGVFGPIKPKELMDLGPAKTKFMERLNKVLEEKGIVDPEKPGNKGFFGNLPHVKEAIAQLYGTNPFRSEHVRPRNPEVLKKMTNSRQREHIRTFVRSSMLGGVMFRRVTLNDFLRRYIHQKVKKLPEPARKYFENFPQPERLKGLAGGDFPMQTAPNSRRSEFPTDERHIINRFDNGRGWLVNMGIQAPETPAKKTLGEKLRGLINIGNRGK